MADFDALLAAAHARGIKVLLDFVPNHTSDRASLVSRKPRVAQQSETRLVHLARRRARRRAAEQLAVGIRRPGLGIRRADRAVLLSRVPCGAARPELAQRRSARRHARGDAVLAAQGVDGFRVDVMWHLIKDDAFRDNPPNPDYREGEPPYRRLLPLYSADRPEVHDVVRGLRAVIDEFPERVLIGEIYLPIERLVAYYGRDLCRRASAVQFQPAGDALARAGDRAIDRSLRGGLAGRRLAELGARQSRPAAARDAHRAGAGARGGHAAADAARHADALLRRRDRHAPGGDAAGCRARSGRAACARPRRRPHADAVGRQRLCRVLDGSSPGFRWRRISPPTTSPASAPSRVRCSISTNG